jgi:hypothetical protein
VDWVDSPFHHKRGGMDVVCKFNCCSTFKGEENLCHSIQTIICKARAIQFTYNNILGFGYSKPENKFQLFTACK